jgi:3-oxoacyl-(acyl-carrier-protein) synthase
VLCNSFGFGGNESSVVLSSEGTDLPVAALDSISPSSRSFALPEDAELGKFVSAAEARRMTPQMRRVVATVRQAMADTGINMPDAIVCATQWGCMLQSMRFLQDMIDSDEQQLKPTPFIQSTHNTVASLIAIMTGNHGYNATYSQGRQSVACATTDITAQLSLGLIRSALLIEFDEQVDAWDAVLCHIGDKTQNIAKVTVFTTK